MKPIRITGAIFLLLILMLLSCSQKQPPPKLPALDNIPLLPLSYEAPPPSEEITSKRHPKHIDAEHIDFSLEVKPILDTRCVVCHACYDAPCQLKLGAPQGIERGATQNKVYDGKRLFPEKPTRLFIDAHSIGEWREKEFFPVLDEQSGQKQAAIDSMLYQMIKLKKDHPIPEDGLLPKSFKLNNYRDLSCPTPNEFQQYRKDHPLWGMPYGLPGLNSSEYKTLSTWLEQGAIFSPSKALPKETASLIREWEIFLNQNDNKSKLASRYIYEHLAFAHFYFSDTGDNTFFELVRSSTPPDKPLKVIATLRPYDDPVVKEVFYRIRRVEETIVDKSHLPYALNQKKMARLKELFWTPDYKVSQLPAYSPDIAANPFATFTSIPAKSRYQFLLDDAHFFIANFIKGPVCWGPIALNVINDHFFVTFTNPETDPISTNDRFLASASPMLNLPAELENNFNLTAAWTLYSKQQQQYLLKKQAFLKKEKFDYTLDNIWKGDTPAGNGALTIFRHHDSASVLKGFIGNTPKTAWVIDFPIFERIYYLLVAGFDVYGNVGHQLSTRLYMDFLRMEGEQNFIKLLPEAEGRAEHLDWYKSIPPRIETFLFERKIIRSKSESAIDKNQSPASSNIDAKNRVIKQLASHTQATASDFDVTSYWSDSSNQKHMDEISIKLQDLEKTKGKNLEHLPDVSYLRVKTTNALDDQVYTLIKNKAHASVHFMYGEDLRRLPKKDSLTVVRGIVGSYPNYIYIVPEAELDLFINQALGMKKEKVATKLNRRWGLRRTHPEFWAEVDWLQYKSKELYGIEAGLFDLNRYLNQ